MDPGHGGVDSGAIANGLEEKNITLPIGLDVGALLSKDGARVLYTRTSDVTVGPPDGSTAGLAARAKIANDAHADAYISIHANSLSDASFSGVMTFAGTTGDYVDKAHRSPELVAQSQLLAQAVQTAVQKETHEIDRGVHSASFYVLGNTSMPSILIETGFLTNPTEAARLASPDFQQAIARGIVQGFESFFGGITTPIKQPVVATDARYVDDVTYPDHTTVAAGQTLIKTWTIANTGTQVWNGSDQLTLQAGGTLQAPPAVALPAVAAGADGTISVPVLVPNQPGSFSATWRLTDSAGQPFGDPLWMRVVVPDPNFRPYWVETARATTLWNDADHHADAVAQLGQWAFLQVKAPQDGDRIAVEEPVSKKDGYVDATAIGPSGPPPAGYTPPAAQSPFQPFWVETTQVAALKSGPSDPSATFGNVPQWTFLQVMAPAAGLRLYVRNPNTGGTAYVDARAVGPSGPPPSDNALATAVTSTPASSTGAPPQPTYTVQHGDTLYGLARRFHVTIDAIIQANGMADANHLMVGQTINLPAGAVTFQPFWVENFAPAALWSGTDDHAQRLGTAPRWTPMQVLAPAAQGRYLVKVWTTGGTAYVDGNLVGPAGPPTGASV